MILFNFTWIKFKINKNIFSQPQDIQLKIKQNNTMSTTHANKIDIIKAATKINEVDFENLSFGSVFTDHLLECDFINGEWQNLLLSLTHHFIRPSARVFHYGQAILKE
jgi:hypothetical protein